MGLHYVLSHLDRPGAYVRILFVDFSWAFNTIIPNLLLPKLTQLSVPTSICQWINSLPYRQAAASEAGKIHIQLPYEQHLSSSGLCSLPTALLSLYTSKDPSVKLLQFADDTTLIGLIQDGDESAYRQEVKELAVWCSLNNPELNTSQNCGDDRGLQEKPPCSPPTYHHEQHCDCSGVIQIPGNHNFSGPEVAQSHRPHCEKGPAEAVLPLPAKEVQPAMVAAEKNVYSAITASVLCTSITVWFSSATKSDHRRLRSVVRTAERIIGTTIPYSPRTVLLSGPLS